MPTTLSTRRPQPQLTQANAGPGLRSTTTGKVSAAATKTSTSKSTSKPKPKATLRANAASNKPKADEVSSDDLVAQIAELTISPPTTAKEKQKQKTSEEEEDKRKLAMRAVNTVSQSLSAVVQSGWKASGTGNAGKRPTAVVDGAAKALMDLRTLCPGDVDVERAASSVVGKLVCLEMVSLFYILFILIRLPFSFLEGI